MSRNRGRKKPKISDLSRNPLSHEEALALIDAVGAADHPITKAVLGAVMVEHELDRLLQRALPRKDDELWAELTKEGGPLSTFHRKITMGFSLRLYNEKIRDDLNIVRNVRNAFAHSGRLISFSNHLVFTETISAHAVPKKIIKGVKDNPIVKDAQTIYAILCFKLTSDLARRRPHRFRARISSPFARAFFNTLNPATQNSAIRSAKPILSLADLPSGPMPESPAAASLYGLLGLGSSEMNKTEKKDE